MKLVPTTGRQSLHQLCHVFLQFSNVISLSLHVRENKTVSMFNVICVYFYFHQLGFERHAYHSASNVWRKRYHVQCLTLIAVNGASFKDQYCDIIFRVHTKNVLIRTCYKNKCSKLQSLIWLDTWWEKKVLVNRASGMYLNA